MPKKILFVTCLASSEIKISQRHMQYMQCKTTHGHFINLVDNDPMRVILTQYIRQFEISVPTKFDEIVNKICLMRIPINVEFFVRKYDAHEYGEIRILEAT